MTSVTLRPTHLGDATWLAVVVAAPPRVRAPKDLADLPRAADLIEIRYDLLVEVAPRIPPAAWVAAAPRPVLFTCRSQAQGGAFTGTAEARDRLLAEARAAGAFLIDREQPPVGAGELHSVHGRDALEHPLTGELSKRALPIDDGAGLERYRAALPAPDGVSIVPYGALGSLRVLALEGRGHLLFGHDGAAVVEGQPALTTLLDELRSGEVGPHARVFGLLGRPPTPSPSPAFHNAVFRATGRDAVYVPLPELSIETALTLPADGYSVTTPLKGAAARHAVERDAWTEATGAANTLVRGSQGWRAYNTDASAIDQLLPQGLAGTARLFGAGGYARAFAAVLRKRGLVVEVHARRPAAARDLAKRLGPGVVAVDREQFQQGPAVVWVNATPLGLSPGERLPVSEEALAGAVVLDAPYHRDGRATGFVQQARAAGAQRIVAGLELLEAQALEQARCFLAGDGGPPAELPRIWELARAPGPSLVLIGPRGVGKSTVGAALARRFGRPFIDTDGMIARVTGHGPEHWIHERGIEVFRALEAEALERALGRRGCVVATGGGAVESPRVRALLAEHHPVIYLAAPPAACVRRIECDAASRPALLPERSLGSELALLAELRTPHYEALSDKRVDARPGLAEVLEATALAWSVLRAGTAPV